MKALEKRVAALEVTGDGMNAIGRVVMITGPIDMEPEQIMGRLDIPTEPNDFYIRLVGVAPEGGKPADSPCSVHIGREWLVVDDKRISE